MQIEHELGNEPRVDSLLGHFLGPLETDAGNYNVAEAHLVELFERMIERGDTGFSTTVAGNLANLYIRMGRWSDAEKYARTCLEVAQPDDSDAQVSGNAALGRVTAQHGDFDAAEMHARRAVDVALETDYLESRGRAFADLAEVLVAAGRRDEAVEAFTRALAEYDAKGATAPASVISKAIRRDRVHRLSRLGHSCVSPRLPARGSQPAVHKDTGGVDYRRRVLVADLSIHHPGECPGRAQPDRARGL